MVNGEVGEKWLDLDCILKGGCREKVKLRIIFLLLVGVIE